MLIFSLLPKIDEQERALDANGLRYVLSMRSFYILNRRIASDPGSPRSAGGIPLQTGWRERLRYRDMIWAFHSESQDLLLSTSAAACNGKMLWSDARALGIFIWLTSVDTMVRHPLPYDRRCTTTTVVRNRKWKLLLETNTWQVATGTLPHARSSTLHWEK